MKAQIVAIEESLHVLDITQSVRAFGKSMNVLKTQSQVDTTAEDHVAQLKSKLISLKKEQTESENKLVEQTRSISLTEKDITTFKEMTASLRDNIKSLDGTICEHEEEVSSQRVILANTCGELSKVREQIGHKSKSLAEEEKAPPALHQNLPHDEGNAFVVLFFMHMPQPF